MNIPSTYQQVEQAGLPVMQDVFSPILNRDVTVKVRSVEPASLDAVKKLIEDNPVIIETALEGVVEGNIYFLCSKKFAAGLTDMMVMGDGTAEFDEQESLDGIAEATNQVIGALSTFWGEQLKSSIQTGGAEARVTSWDQLDIPFDELVMVVYDVEVSDWGEEPFIRLAPVSVLDPLAEMPNLANMTVSTETGTESPAQQQAGTYQPVEEPTVRPAEFASFDAPETRIPTQAEPKNLDLLLDITLPVTIELGRTTMLISDVLDIGPGSVIELQKLSGEPVDLYVNDKKFALGEVVVIDENFGIRITELINPEERLKALK